MMPALTAASKEFGKPMPSSIIREAARPGLLPLARRRLHHEAVEFGLDPDLAGQARGRAHVEGEVEHVLLHRLRLADGLLPGLIHVNMARRAGAGAAALGRDPWDVVAQRRLHDGRADFSLHGARRPVRVAVRDLHHPTHSRTAWSSEAV